MSIIMYIHLCEFNILELEKDLKYACMNVCMYGIYVCMNVCMCV